MSWVAIRRFKAGDPESARVKKHWEDVAEDLGLLAEGSVALEQDGDEEILFVSETVNEFFQGQPGYQYS